MVYTYHIISETPLQAEVRNPFGDTVFRVNQKAIAPSSNYIMSSSQDLPSLLAYLIKNNIVLPSHTLVTAETAEQYEKNVDENRFEQGGLPSLSDSTFEIKSYKTKEERMFQFVNHFDPGFRYGSRSYLSTDIPFGHGVEEFVVFYDVIIPETASNLPNFFAFKKSLLELANQQKSKFGVRDCEISISRNPQNNTIDLQI
jgi:hypothetical protein